MHQNYIRKLNDYRDWQAKRIADWNMKSVRSTMIAHWEHWNPNTAQFDDWINKLRDGASWSEVRCTIAEKRITVWLPKGAKIILHLSKWKADSDREHYLRNEFFYYYYGSFDSGNRTRIRLWIKDGAPVLP